MKRQDLVKNEREISLIRGNYYFIKKALSNQYLTLNKLLDYEMEDTFFSELDKFDSGQIWMIQQVAQGTFQIVHGYSSSVFELVVDQIKIRSNKMKNCQTFWVQKWISSVQIPDGNIFVIKQFKNSKKFLYQENDQLKCMQKASYQDESNKWKLQLVQQHPLIDQSCIIQNCRSGQVMQVYQSSPHEGKQIIQNNLTNCFNQRWIIEAKNQFVIIKSLRSGFVLDIKGESTKQGTNIIQFKFKDSLNQKWILQSHGKRVYIIRSALNKHLMLGIKGNSLKEGAELVTTKNQAEAFWRIIGNLPI